MINYKNFIHYHFSNKSVIVYKQYLSNFKQSNNYCSIAVNYSKLINNKYLVSSLFIFSMHT